MGWWSDTNSWHNRGLKRLLICTERHTRVIDAFVALAGAILTRRLIRIALTNHRWGTRPARRGGLSRIGTVSHVWVFRGPELADFA